MRLSLVTVALAMIVGLVLCTQMPLPFTRELVFQQATFHMAGNDVVILQQLVRRSPFVGTLSNEWRNGQFDNITAHAVSRFQQGNSLPVTGKVDASTAIRLLELHMSDNYKDDPRETAKLLPFFKYKLYVPVFRNRSIETMATLFDNKMKELHRFKVRTQGQFEPGTSVPRNMLSNSGSTPTGLGLFDFNSPEPDPVSYGKWPVNRVVSGLRGNMLFMLPAIRNGILLHTGEWAHWNSSMPMPNSHGCMHSHPQDIESIVSILQQIDVQIRPNTLGALPYPYPTQGLISVEQLD